VESVGLKTTRIRSLSGEQLIFSNSDLLKSRIRNFKSLVKRRVVFQFGVSYETSADKLALIPVKIKQIIEAQEKTQFDRSHFVKFNDISLAFETVYFVLDAAYNTYMDIQQKVNLEIVSFFEKEDIQFAYIQSVANSMRSASSPR